MNSGRPEILVIADRPGWAIERKTDNLLRVLGERLPMVKRFQTDVQESDIDRADLVQVFFWMQFEKMAHLEAAFRRNAAKLLIGICSHEEVRSQRRDPGMERLRQARAVFVNSQLLLAEVRGLFDQPTFLTPNGVDTAFFRPAFRADERRALRVGWTGSLSNHGALHRGLPNLIEPALAGLDGVELATAAREERWRTMAEMLEFYRSLDVYLCASRSEGTPNPCLEAAACGIPVVTTRVGNMPEFIRDGVNGFFIEPDVADIRARLRLLADDGERRAAMGAAARRTALDWDWTRRAEAYYQMYRSVT